MKTLNTIARWLNRFLSWMAVPLIVGVIGYHQGRADGFERGSRAGVVAATAVTIATIRNYRAHR